MSETITKEDIEGLRAVNELNESRGKIVEEENIWDKPIQHECEKHKLDAVGSKALVEYSKQHTVREAAEVFGVHTRTVYRHRERWREESESMLDKKGYVTSRVCGVMREMAHDGVGQVPISEYFDRSRATIHRHVTGKCNCECDVPEVTYE